MAPRRVMNLKSDYIQIYHLLIFSQNFIVFIFQLTYADITFFSLCNIFAEGEPTVPKQLTDYPLLVEHYNRVLNVPGIKAWVEKRPKTDH